jgi:hypothetical protein
LQVSISIWKHKLARAIIDRVFKSRCESTGIFCKMLE